MPSKSKSKGNRGEHELAKMLSAIFGGHFARVPNSGAMIGGSNAFRKTILSDTQNKIYKGDLIAPDHMPKMILEVKNYSEFRFHQLLMPEGCSQLDEWIKQTLETLDEGDESFICFKISRTGWFICLPETSAKHYVFSNHCVYSSKHGEYRITGMPTFLDQNSKTILERTA